MAEGREFTGWGQIAEHLGVSVRTAQIYERDLNLPVHRLPGPRGRVWAIEAELVDWKRNVAQPGALENVSEFRAGIGGAGVLTEERKKRPAWPSRAAIAILAVALLGAAAASYLSWTPARPSGYRVSGSTLTVLGENGKELWHHNFPAQLRESQYSGDFGHGNRCLFVDLDGDGNLETLFSFSAVDNVVPPKLICFTSGGRIRWQFSPEATIRDNQSREWGPPFYPNSFSVISMKAGPPMIAVSSNHHWGFTDQVAVLDAAGKMKGEFWHRGHLTEMATADLDGDGQPELLMGGVNDAPEYKQATLLVFDPRRVSGASSSPAGNGYFQNLGPGSQRVVIYFGKTRIAQRREFNRISDIQVLKNKLLVIVSESEIAPNPDFVLYEMDFQLNLVNIMISDTAKAHYLELESKGGLPKNSLVGEIERLKRELQVIRR